MQGDHIMVHFSSAAPLVDVPESLRGEPSLTLKLSYNFQGATETTEEAITSYLKFSGAYYQCVIPWDSIWGFTSESGEQRLFPEDIPPEVVKEAAVKKLRGLLSTVTGALHRPAKGAEASANQAAVEAAQPLEKHSGSQHHSAPQKGKVIPFLKRVK